MTRTALAYTRQSQSRTDEEDSLSLALQERRIRDYGTRNDYEVVAVYSDIDVSGNVEFRTGLDAMLLHCKAGGIDAVIIFNISRLARDTMLFLKICKELERSKIVLLSASESMDDRTVVTVLSAFSERERITLSNTIAFAVRESARRGKMILRPPFGYRLTGGDVFIVESEAEIVRRIFAAYVAGKTTGEILDALHRDGVATPTGLPIWHRSTLTKMLRNHAYAGRIAISETRDPIGRVRPALITEGNHASIVDSETWNTAQRLLDAERPARRVTRYPAPWLAGAIVCAVCGQRVYIELLRSKAERLQPYWVARCASNRRAANTSQPNMCTGQPLSAYRSIDRAARLALAADLGTLLDPHEAMRNAVTFTGRDQLRRGDELRTIVAESDARLARVYLAYEAGDIPLELHRQRRTALEHQRDEARAELTTVPVLPEIGQFSTARDALIEYAEAIPIATDDDLRAIVTELGAVAVVDLRSKCARWTYAEPYCWIIGSRVP